LEVESGSTVRLWPGWMKRPSGWMDDGSGGRSQGLLHLHPQKYTGAESGVVSFFIPKKTVQSARTDEGSGGFRGCFNSHPQKNSSKQFIQNGIRGCFISHPQKFSYIRCLISKPPPYIGLRSS